MTHLLKQLGYVPESLSKLAQGIGRKLGMKVMGTFAAMVSESRDASRALGRGARTAESRSEER